MATVRDCERVQTRWFAVRAAAQGGTVWTDEDLLWTDGPDGLNLLFPRTLSAAAVQRGVDRAHELGRGIVGAWLDLEVDPAPLAEAGFERGWSPWWMTADLSDVPRSHDPRVRLEPGRAWYATAHVPPTGTFAGHAWSFRDGDLAGVFDMEVWPRFRRQGLGTALLSAVCESAAGAGAREAVLNATPEGKQLYDRRGFRQIGEGITWWHHTGSRTGQGRTA